MVHQNKTNLTRIHIDPYKDKERLRGPSENDGVFQKEEIFCPPNFLAIIY